MSSGKLAFLQNFYTDVTLYVPAEPSVSPPASSLAPAEGPAATPSQPTPPGHLQPAPAPAAPAPTMHLPPDAGSFPAANAPGAAPANKPAIAPSPVTPTEPAVPPVMLTQFTTLGSNAQGLVLLFRLPHEQFLKLHRNVFLNKMLQALGLVMADVVLVNVESELPVALVNLRRELAATRVIAFGKNLLDVTIRNTQIYEPVLFPSLSLSYLASATVDLVEYDVSLKKRLWLGLQRMFNPTE
ncbi:hypothetical protein IC235_14105 [Hymenobacter sp. BT664]|uniref:Uncharacterized protein n=1 Tax=Hymenobacter montanus TaxID=2771359 RepID=A0A927BFE7_9BACT|nr:hypothetical protein [Hymenobacter montanus]MBD2769022.1 hypothetical protein [Hymenobacter montanus]